MALEDRFRDDIVWCWVDLFNPSEEEYVSVLKDHFHFHPLAIEDCLENVQRPKIDFYNGYHFLVLHSISKEELTPKEVDVFVGESFCVSFHWKEEPGLNDTWNTFAQKERLKNSPLHVTHMIIDRLVDDCFPPLYFLEDRLNEIDDHLTFNDSHSLEEVFEIRSELSRVRRTIVPMRDLLYRILNSERFYGMSDQSIYFKDIYDHLLKLSEMIEANRELTADIRDSYFSLNSNYMNNIMKTLTVFSTIFMPLTFIAGVYGMNFSNMPELNWKYGYFICIFLMLFIFVAMMIWFHKKGWFK